VTVIAPYLGRSAASGETTRSHAARRGFGEGRATTAQLRCSAGTSNHMDRGLASAFHAQQHCRAPSQGCSSGLIRAASADCRKPWPSERADAGSRLFRHGRVAATTRDARMTCVFAWSRSDGLSIRARLPQCLWGATLCSPRRSSTPAMRWVSPQAGLVEHRDECRAPAVLLAQLDDVLGERLRVARGRRGVSRALEDPHGGGVGSAIRLL